MKNKKYYSNGKLLLTGEYVVLDGATALAVPTKFGQDLIVEPALSADREIEEPQLIWGSFTHTGKCWFEAVFDLPKLRLANTTFDSTEEGSSEFIAETLQSILLEARKLNPEFLNTEKGFVVKTNLTFPKDWGLGSSSTLINNIAQWAEINPYELLWNAFSGSGYDIACAQNNAPILYQLKDSIPNATSVSFLPAFYDRLFFVYLNQKQNSREGIARYRKNQEDHAEAIQRVSQISNEILTAYHLSEFENLINEHEQIISQMIQMKSVKERLFPDYWGGIKSLGAWGGDFILATGNENTPDYFKGKDYNTVIPYSDMVL